MSRCTEMGFDSQECMEAHKGHKFTEDVEGYGGGGGGYSKPSVKQNGCRKGYKMQDGQCVKADFQIDIEITVDDMVLQASTGEYIVAISGIAFHQGINKNGWEITRKEQPCSFANGWCRFNIATIQHRKWSI